jgi:exodeoxyribonuclease-3
VRIASWNVNSVAQRLPRLLPWLDERRPDVVCLQEAKLADDKLAELLDDDPYTAHGMVEPNPTG